MCSELWGPSRPYKPTQWAQMAEEGWLGCKDVRIWRKMGGEEEREVKEQREGGGTPPPPPPPPKEAKHGKAGCSPFKESRQPLCKGSYPLR